MLRRIALDPTLGVVIQHERTTFTSSHKDAPGPSTRVLAVLRSVGDKLPNLVILCRVFLTRSS